jgi:predicted RecA/RadA family phage recombinase
MAAAAADREASRSEGDLVAYLVEAGERIYSGTLTRLDADGYLLPASDTASAIFAGVAADTFNNVGGADGAADATDGKARCRVWKSGVFEFTCASATQAWVGAAMYAVDDQTVALAATTTNDLLVGYCTEFISATRVRVRIDRAVQ